VPPTRVINFSAGQTRANNAILTVATDGSGTVTFLASLAGGGTVHLIVDVNGYFL
jgi:ABC-type cobalamin transport system ATPase subunit